MQHLLVPLSLKRSHPEIYARIVPFARALVGDPSRADVIQRMIRTVRPDLVPEPVKAKPDNPKPSTVGEWSLQAAAFAPHHSDPPPIHPKKSTLTHRRKFDHLPHLH